MIASGTSAYQNRPSRVNELEREGRPMNASAAEPAIQSPVPRVFQGTVLDRPLFKYVGFALLLSWHYVFWFVPSIFASVNLMDDRVTFSWLTNLLATAAFAFAFALVLGRKRHLSSCMPIVVAAPAALALGSLGLAVLPFDHVPSFLWYTLVIALGACEAIFWIIWSERFACEKANFSIRHIGTTFGVTLLLSIAVAHFLPSSLTAPFASLLLVISGALLFAACRNGSTTFPVLLPRNVAMGGVRNLLMVGFLTLFATAACYFLVAIIPWEDLPFSDHSFTVGILLGALFMLVIGGGASLAKERLNAFKIYPWLFVAVIFAFALFLADRQFYAAAFDIGVGLSSIFEVLLIMYFGILITKGYVTSSMGFACACGFSRLGICLGNAVAVTYESMPEVAFAITPETALALMCLLAALLIPLVRQEFSIIALTTLAPTKSEIEEICSEAAKEFNLSGREEDVLLLIARGYTTKAIADKLVLSPYTVNTHIRHIYDKMQIHKRSELINYLNMQRSDF